MAQNPHFKIYKETALPSKLEAHSIYLISTTEKPDHYEMYVTNADGTKAKRQFGEIEVKALLAEFNASRGQLSVVDTIANRNAIQTKVVGTEVFVKDATQDPTVKLGAARYLWDGDSWIKVSESESMDLNLSWNALNDKPSSSVQQIDTAVANSHTHSNISQLNKIGEDTSGNLTYGGNPVKTEWSSNNW
nr:MAG TPA: hypothetical protein [Caudoviricetes sp.]